MSEGEVAALLAGASPSVLELRRIGGGSTYIVPEDPTAVFVDTRGGGRGILMLSSGLGAQCIPTTALSAFFLGS